MTLFKTCWVSAAFILAACSGGPDVPVDVTQSPYFGPNDRVIDVDGQSVRYRQSGPETGQVVLLLHGFTDSLHTWDAVADTLDETFNVIRMDLPGHGLSGPSPDEDYSNDALVEFIGDFLDETDINAPILVGNSLGGLAAWRYAADHSDTLSGLVLLAPGGVPYNGVSDEPVAVPAMLKFYLKSAPEAGVKTALTAMYADDSQLTEARITEYRELMAGQGDAFVARAAQFTLPDPAEALVRIYVPTRILWGEADTVLPVSQADVFEVSLPDADIVRLQGVGHLPQAEAPDAVIEAIRSVAMDEGATP